jgi:isopropylmalate/homocitrate/citramalate synthase
MALAAGADVAHTTIAAIGERAGNTSYEEVAFGLLTTYGKDTGLDISKMYSTAHFLYDMAGITCRPNRGIIGPDISKMESGLVIGWYENLKKVNPLILFPYLFPITGHPDITYTIGKHSGAPTVRYYLNQMGIKDPSDDFVRDLVDMVKEKAYELGHALELDQFDVLVKELQKSSANS